MIVRFPFLLSRSLSAAASTTATTWIRLYHVSVVDRAGEKWRREHGLSRSGNEYGPLTDLPDWTFVGNSDGRPSVLGKGQRRRQIMQLAFSKRIKKLLKSVDLAKETDKPQ